MILLPSASLLILFLLLLVILIWVKRVERLIERYKKYALAGELAASLIHEIKNPLGVISLNLQLLKERLEQDKELDKHYFERKIDSLMKGVENINKMLQDFSGLIKEPKLKLENFNIVDIIDELEAELLMTLQKKGITLVKYVAKKNIRVHADRQALKQAILNILINAYEALDITDREEKTIFLKVSEKRGRVLIEIIDNGPGIQKAYIDKVFNAYFTTKEHGTGLGLSITKKIIESHNGSISINSELGQGTRVLIEIPIRVQ